MNGRPWPLACAGRVRLIFQEVVGSNKMTLASRPEPPGRIAFWKRMVSTGVLRIPNRHRLKGFSAKSTLEEANDQGGST